MILGARTFWVSINSSPRAMQKAREVIASSHAEAADKAEALGYPAGWWHGEKPRLRNGHMVDARASYWVTDGKTGTEISIKHLDDFSLIEEPYQSDPIDHPELF